MNITQKRLIDLIADPEKQYVVPVYQRVYSWTTPLSEALLRDSLLASYEKRSHFVGTLLFRDAGQQGEIKRFALIDGQQRLATVVLLAVVLRERLLESGDEIPAWIDECMTISVNGIEEPKIILARPDRDTFASLITGADLSEDAIVSELVDENLEYFRHELSDPKFDTGALIDGLARLTVVAAELGDNDRPQLVFESLNAKGMPLKTSDLIRNLLLTQLGREEQIRLFEKYWEPLEDRFDEIEATEKAERAHKIGIPPQDRNVEWEGLALDAALHAWLLENSEAARPETRAGLYDSFKNHVQEHPEITLEDLLKSINTRCNTFADEFETPEAREHIDWAIGKAQGFGGR